MAHPFQVTYDAHDPAVLARFWALALGYVEQPPPPGFETWDDFAEANDLPADQRAAAVDPDGNGPRVFFQKVPEGKTAKNRVHLDVQASVSDAEFEVRKAQIDRHVGRLEAAGATRQVVFEEERPWITEYWVVMQDPEGNEFCVV